MIIVRLKNYFLFSYIFRQNFNNFGKKFLNSFRPNYFNLNQKSFSLFTDLLIDLINFTFILLILSLLNL